MTREEGRAKAARTLREYRASGQSQRQYCKAAGIKLSSLSYWLKREREASGVGGGSRGTESKFVPVVPRSGEVKAQGQPLVVVLRGGTRLEVPSGYSLKELVRVAAALEGAGSC